MKKCNDKTTKFNIAINNKIVINKVLYIYI